MFLWIQNSHNHDSHHVSMTRPSSLPVFFSHTVLIGCVSSLLVSFTITFSTAASISVYYVVFVTVNICSFVNMILVVAEYGEKNCLFLFFRIVLCETNTGAWQGTYFTIHVYMLYHYVR